MGKLLIVAVLTFCVAVFLAVRYRKQIVFMIRLGRVLRRAGRQGVSSATMSQESKGVELVRCVSCGAWLSESEALTLPGAMHRCAQGCEVKVRTRS